MLRSLLSRAPVGNRDARDEESKIQQCRQPTDPARLVLAGDSGQNQPGASPISCEEQRLSHSLLVSGRFAMIYVVDVKFFESTAGDADRCLESPTDEVRDRARVESPEPVMRRLLRRKVK